MTFVALATVAFVASLALVAVLRRAAEKLGILDLPNERSSHTRPTPRGGGLAIVVVSLGLLVAVAATSSGLSFENAGLLLAAVAIAAIGLVDDIRSMRAVTRLCMQVAIAGAIVWLSDVAAASAVWVGAGPLRQGLLIAVVMMWVVGMINAYNFMDGIDGIAGVQAVIAGIAWAAAASAAGAAVPAAAGAVVGGAAAGFLIHNWSPARIFMGDVGSGFLGVAFALLPLLVAQQPDWALFGVAVVWPFVFDAVFTFVRRAARGENLLAAHRTHLYQRLVQAGFSHARVTSWYGAQATLAAATGFAALQHVVSLGIAAVILLAVAAASWCAVCVAERRAVRVQRRAFSAEGTQS